MNPLTLAPPAKVNLGLLIKGKRPDGYHLLETLFYPVRDLCDRLTLSEAREAQPTLEVTNMVLAGDPQDNLCLRAWHALQAEVPDLPPVHLTLEKHIPAGAGLGGGSSDAAYVLRGRVVVPDENCR